jgi:aminoglycoside phosphotransferase (APT) family kinase protein
MPRDDASDGGATGADPLEALLRRTLRQTPATAALADARLERIAAGSSHPAWRAIVDGAGMCFVRLAASTPASLGSDLQAEARVLARVVDAGLAPRVLYNDPTRGLLVTEWIDSVERSPGAPRPGEIEACADGLARLHAVPAPAGVRRVDFRSQAEQLRRHASARTIDPGMEECAARVFRESAARCEVQCLCHNDLNPSNVLVDRTGRVRFVDWEYAGLGDPAYDLASYACTHELDAASCAVLLAAYGARAGRIEGPRLTLACWGFDYVQALWYRALAAAPAAASLDRATARDRAARLENSLHRRASALARGDNAPLDS